MSGGFKVTILWGKHPEEGDTGKTYEFDTQAELDAFTLGVEEMDGWMGYEIVEEGYVHGPSDGVDDDD